MEIKIISHALQHILTALLGIFIIWIARRYLSFPAKQQFAPEYDLAPLEPIYQKIKSKSPWILVIAYFGGALFFYQLLLSLHLMLIESFKGHLFQSLTMGHENKELGFGMLGGLLAIATPMFVLPSFVGAEIEKFRLQGASVQSYAQWSKQTMMKKNPNLDEDHWSIKMFDYNYFAILRGIGLANFLLFGTLTVFVVFGHLTFTEKGISSFHFWPKEFHYSEIKKITLEVMPPEKDKEQEKIYMRLALVNAEGEELLFKQFPKEDPRIQKVTAILKQKTGLPIN